MLRHLEVEITVLFIALESFALNPAQWLRYGLKIGGRGKVPWFFWLGIHKCACMQINPYQSIKKKAQTKNQNRRTRKINFHWAILFFSRKKRPVILPEKKFPQQFYLKKKRWWTTHSEGEEEWGQGGHLGLQEQAQDRAWACRAAACGSWPVSASVGSLRGAELLCPQNPPILAKSGYIFIAFLQVIEISGGGQKIGEGGKGRQFPVFVIIIGYIYRKKVN